MSTAPSLEDQLAADLRRSLLPHPFAPRRDLEVAGMVRDRESLSCFFDAFWLVEGRLALVVARLHRGGVAGALRAACLQRLARTALSLCAGPEAALGTIRELFGREYPGETVDLLLATLDTASGHFAHAGHGSGFVIDAAGDIDHDAGRDPVAWLICRDGGIDPARLPASGEELGAAARCVADLAGPGSAVLGLLHRGSRRPGPHQTFAMPNDLGAISRLTTAVEAALAAADVPEAVGAAFGLALDELLTNVVSYGFADGGRHEILVDLSIEAEAVEVRLRDDGRPFDPLRLLEPDLTSDVEERQVGGLGIYFVRQSMDNVDYARETGWNVLRLRKGFVREHGQMTSGDRA